MSREYSRRHWDLLVLSAGTAVSASSRAFDYLRDWSQYPPVENLAVGNLLVWGTSFAVLAALLTIACALHCLRAWRNGPTVPALWQAAHGLGVVILVGFTANVVTGLALGEVESTRTVAFAVLSLSVHAVRYNQSRGEVRSRHLRRVAGLT